MNKDLNKYMFQHFENAFNIGWNDNKSANNQKVSLDDKFYEQLKLFCESPLNYDLNGKHREIEVDGKKYVKGFGEIRILDLNKKIRYAAPNIIIDDILEGIYIPDSEFVEAVKLSPKPGEIEYEEFISRYNPDTYWGEEDYYVQKINSAVAELSKGIKEFRYCIEDNDIKNCVTLDGSLLNYAINIGKNDIASYLIEAGIDINIFGGIELLNAIKMNMTEVADVLIEKDIYMDDTVMNANPLVSAIRSGDKHLVLKLLNKKPELVKTYSNEFVRNCTMLDIARRCNNTEIIDILQGYVMEN
ncbi:ankyrin repeat domain-containing protein [Anaerocolumna sp. AGMB13025]|uniref:DUF7919 family protein n=1 Tax=Anaerocolumna sp. AGMB13025 TaxID=3039116 RepID=UPI00241FEEE5|nr:ankyrin repeat domain-containing protein [Anaerocolumna sp. AGMB13025]WFR59093.1 ankyrin repeat domain-containing protein [Anaerocolumna sp. AGMB13025]